MRGARRGHRAADAREKRYAQDALVALVRTEPARPARAFERFTPEGPLALLPLAGRYALVWSCRPERAAELAQCAEERFLRAARRRRGTPARHARSQAEARALQPLALRVHPTRVAQRAVYIGNAAQTLHPVAGQGLNLGLRDAWDLSRAFVESRDPGDAATLARYAAQPQARRASDDPRHRRARRRVSGHESAGARGARRGAHGARSFSRAAAILRAPHDLWAFRAAVKKQQWSRWTILFARQSG